MLGLLLVLALHKSFVSILEVIELVLEPIESTIECIADILKFKNVKREFNFFFGSSQTQIPTCGASGSSKTFGILPSTF